MRSFLGVLIHVVRNSVDHGIEGPDERLRVGKPRAGRVSIESRLDGAAFVIVVEDDGRGIDWDTIRQRARLRALPYATENDLEEALFTDGITTRDAVTDLSGRGVGLSAVRQICAQMGGSIQVQSRRGLGTRFEFRFAAPASLTATKLVHSAAQVA
jgi:two-component system chemotaxis sensor kinase CheA